MTTTVAPSTMGIWSAPAEERDPSMERMYRLRKSFVVVNFERAGKGRIVFLPEGAELRVIGPSCLCECLEVMHENRLYNIFKVDLLGAWSDQIESRREMA